MKTGFQLVRARWRQYLGPAALGIFLMVLAGFLTPQPAVSQVASPISGWAWSDTIGWIKMSDSTAGYGLTVDQSTDVVSGYAWSDNIGWVSANAADISVCGAGATSKLQNGAWTGWLRAIAGGTAQSGGWDGCISMSGAGYGVVLDTSGSFKPCDSTTQSCAWEGNTDPGAAVVGWVDFSHAGYQCTPPIVGFYCKTVTAIEYSCSYDTQCTEQCNKCDYGCNINDGQCNGPPIPSCNIQGCIQVHPPLVSTGNTGVDISWDVSNVQTCSSGVTATNGQSWAAPVVSGTATNPTPEPRSSALTSATTFTLICTDLNGAPYAPWTATAQFVPSFNEF